MNTIRIEVEVPADVTVTDPDTLDPERFQVLRFRDDGRLLFMPQGGGWLDSLGRQIAAAVEARRPKPPKFAVGDVVEWSEDGEQRAGVVSGVSSHDFNPLYRLNGHKSWAKPEIDLTLVRRAAK